MTAFRNGKPLFEIEAPAPNKQSDLHPVEQRHFRALFSACKKRGLYIKRLGFNSYHLSDRSGAMLFAADFWGTMNYLDSIKLTKDQQQKLRSLAQSEMR
jgi:hypothetical protein